MRTGAPQTTHQPASDAAVPVREPGRHLAEPVTESRAERQEPGGPSKVRIVHHPGAYDLRGMPVWCVKCRARRDWAFISQSRNVWVVCRCGEMWHEPEIGRADFDAVCGAGESVTYVDLEDAMRSMGFDGTFRGIYLG